MRKSSYFGSLVVSCIQGHESIRQNTGLSWSIWCIGLVLVGGTELLRLPWIPEGWVKDQQAGTEFGTAKGVWHVQCKLSPPEAVSSLVLTPLPIISSLWFHVILSIVVPSSNSPILSPYSVTKSCERMQTTKSCHSRLSRAECSGPCYRPLATEDRPPWVSCYVSLFRVGFGRHSCLCLRNFLRLLLWGVWSGFLVSTAS